MIRRYHHGPVVIHADPDFEESPDGDVVLWVDHLEDVDSLQRELTAVTNMLDQVREERGIALDALCTIQGMLKLSDA